MIVVPAPGVAEDATGVPELAWENRGRIGVLRAWWRTVIRTLSAPGDAMQSVPATSPLSGPILFAGLTSLFGTLVGAAFMAIGISISAAFSSLTTSGLMRLVLVQLAILGANVIFAIIATLIAGFVAHVALVVLRAARASLSRTLQATLYGSGAAYAVSLIPCPCAGITGIVWWCVCLAAMYRVAHTTTTARSVIATLVALVVSISAAAGLAMIPELLGAGNQSWVRFSSSNSSAATGDDIAEAFAEAMAADQAWPRTPLDLVVAGHIDGEHIANIIALNGGDEVVIGQLPPEALRDEDVMQIRAESDRLAAILPADNRVFRLGRSIFAYRGVAADARDAWLVILEPRRHRDGTPRTNLWTIVTLDGPTRLTDEEVYAQLKVENDRRRQASLPPIPPPDGLADLVTGVVPRAIPHEEETTPPRPESPPNGTDTSTEGKN